MITTVILYVAFAVMDIFDQMLSGLGFIKSASSVFTTMFLYIDAVVYYVRSLLPFTISAIFTIIFQLFTIWVIFFFARWILSTLPLFGSSRD